MGLKYKLIPVLLLVFLIKCNSKKTEEEKNLNNEASIKKEAERILENKAKTFITSYKNSSIIKKDYEIRDLDKDGILDVILFLCIEDLENKSFKGTEIVFLKNNKKKLIFKDSSFYSKKHITPNKEENKYNKDYCLTEELLADLYGNLNYSTIREGNITYFNRIYYDYTSDNKDFDNYYETTSIVPLDLKFKTYRQRNVIKYCTAKAGLLCRDAPTKRGKVLCKFDYGSEINVIGITDQKAIVFDVDLNKQIEGNWVLVKVFKKASTTSFEEEEEEETFNDDGDNNDYDETYTGYIFNGYLESNNNIYFN